MIEKRILDDLFETRRPIAAIPRLDGGLLPPNHLLPNPGRPANARRRWFAVYLTKVKANQTTKDDLGADGAGDEVLVRCAVGHYSKSRSLFAITMPFKSETKHGVHTKDDAADGLPALICAPELVEQDHVVLIAPTIWEQDEAERDDDGLTDRAAAFHEHVMSLEEDIKRHVGGNGGARFGVSKSGEDYGFPFVAGTTGRNRPIGMTKGKTGRLEFFPKLIVLDLQEATDRQGKALTINYRDDATLGGNYTLEFMILPVQ